MDGMDEQTRAYQIWLESHSEEPDPYYSYTGQKVSCPRCNKYVSIVSKTRDLENENSHIAEFKTSCKHVAYGVFSDGYDAEWCFWIN